MLVERVTGLQDKMFFIELYPADTQFDVCGKPSTPHLHQVMIEDGPDREADAGSLSEIHVQDGQISLVYGSADPLSLSELQVSWRPAGAAK